MWVLGYFPCLLRNLYAGCEAIVRKGHRTTDCFKIGKGVCQGCILSLCLFSLYAEYIMQMSNWMNPKLESILLGGNINHLRYADDTTLKAESEEELKSLLMRVKEEWKSWLKTQHSKDENLSIQSHHFISNREKVKTVTDFIFLDSKSTVDGDCSHEIKRFLVFGRKAMTNLAC